MNKAAYEALVTAQTAYLVANGWVELSPDQWREPKDRRGRVLNMGHAVNSQLFHDRTWSPPPPPETPEHRLARFQDMIRTYWREAHVALVELRAAVTALLGDVDRQHPIKCVSGGRIYTSVITPEHLAEVDRCLAAGAKS